MMSMPKKLLTILSIMDNALFCLQGRNANSNGEIQAEYTTRTTRNISHALKLVTEKIFVLT